MAAENKLGEGQVTSQKKSDPLAAARAARKPKDPNAIPLTDNQKFAVANLRQAAKACKMVISGIEKGNNPSAEVMQSAAILSGAVSSGLFA